MSDFHILIVEDNGDLRTVMELRFQKCGYSTTSAAAAEQAMDFLKDNSTDLVVTDLGMPFMGGAELVQEIRSFSSVPIIIYSGTPDKVMHLTRLKDVSLILKGEWKKLLDCVEEYAAHKDNATRNARSPV